MLFSSIPFLYYFLPAVVISYFLISWAVEGGLKLAGVDAAKAKKAGLFTKNLILLCFSLVFYAWGEPLYVFLMIGTILMFWGTGWAIGAAKQQFWKRFWLIFAIVSSIGILAVFKYADFFIENVNALTGLNMTLLKLALPVGISFYTFQALSYTIDVYRGDTQVQKDPISFGAYVTLFPQLIAGPIVRYVDVARELKDRTHTWGNIALGLRRFLVGLGKKIILADNFALLMNMFRRVTSLCCSTGSMCWPLPLTFTLTSPVIPIWPSALARCSALTLLRTSITPICPSRWQSSGAAGT